MKRQVFDDRHHTLPTWMVERLQRDEDIDDLRMAFRRQRNAEKGLWAAIKKAYLFVKQLFTKK